MDNNSQDKIEDKLDKAARINWRATEVVIDTIDSYRRACALLMIIKRSSKEIKETFSPIKTKAYETWKEVVSQEKRHLSILDGAEGKIKDKLKSYLKENKDMENEDGRITFRNDWKFKIIDGDLIPREFMSINESLIRERVRSLGDVVQIPGVEIWKENSIVANTSKEETDPESMSLFHIIDAGSEENSRLNSII